MDGARRRGGFLLKAVSVFHILLGVLTILALPLLAFGGYALGLSGGELLVFGLTCLGVLTLPVSLAGLAAGVLGLAWCGRTDKLRVLLALGAALTAATALNPLLGRYNTLVTGFNLLRLAAAGLFVLAVRRSGKNLR